MSVARENREIVGAMHATLVLPEGSKARPLARAQTVMPGNTPTLVLWTALPAQQADIKTKTGNLVVINAAVGRSRAQDP